MKRAAIAAAALLAMSPAAAAPSAMPDDAILKAWPGEQPTYAMGRFSPDGGALAFVAGQLAGANDQAWLYDLKSGRLAPVTEAPKRKGLNTEIRDMAWGADGVLYISADDDKQDGSGVRDYKVAVKNGVPSAIADFPKDIQALFDANAKAEDDFDNSFIRNVSGGAYVVTIQDVYHGDHRLTARRKGSSKPLLVVNGGGELRGFLFDRQRSILRYIDETNRAIAAFDLRTGKAAALVRYGATEADLLDQTKDGTLLAYTRFGPCGSTAQAGSSAHYSICFVSLSP